VGPGGYVDGEFGDVFGWRKAYLDKIWDHEGDLDSVELLALAAFGGSALTRVSGSFRVREMILTDRNAQG